MKKEKNKCVDCGRGIGRKSTRCLFCGGKYAASKLPKKFNPSKEELVVIIKGNNGNMCAVGRHYNVSDNAIRKRCKKLNIEWKEIKK